MASPPSTPPPKPPATRKEERFVDRGDPCEWCELYRPGGFHPAHLEDSFKDGRYRVIRKLGDGSFGTVWLAVDDHCESHRYVALKIMMSKRSADAATEMEINSYLSFKASRHPHSKHALLPLNTFEHAGPNGTHRCFVYEPMGATVASMLSELPQYQPKRLMATPKRYPKWMAKLILKHVLSGLVFLHSNGVAHGDVQPGNFLFSIGDINTVKEEELKQPQKSVTKPLRRRDGKTDKWAPRYLMLKESLHTYTSLDPDLLIKISDFGAAFWIDKPPASTVTPVALRAPELIFKEPFDSGIDIWAFGCQIYEILTGSQLFAVFSMGDDPQEDIDDDHLNELHDVLGPLPEAWFSKWSRAHLWFGPNGERLNPRLDEEEPEEEGVMDEDPSDYEDMQDLSEDEVGPAIDERNRDDDLSDGNIDDDDPDPTVLADAGPTGAVTREDEIMATLSEPLEVQFEKNKPDDINAEEARVITSLIRSILQYDRSKRPTAEELLQHEWFRT
ncbi:hypothetical protein FQN52_003274 [Onygenales sp. PD_12]|nr:hypothetical protein FQN52_003274 [Onygenales sp. PD_12]